MPAFPSTPISPRRRACRCVLLLQRLHEAAPGRAAGAHLDIATDDPDALATAHERRGARVHRRHDCWITMTDPSGLPYCLVRRAPDTDRLP